jgi:hypothetical protein
MNPVPEGSDNTEKLEGQILELAKIRPLSKEEVMLLTDIHRRRMRHVVIVTFLTSLTGYLAMIMTLLRSLMPAG